jgi:hypothetical protein
VLQSLRDGGADIILFDAAARDNLRVLMLGLQTLGWKAKVVAAIGSYSGNLVEQIPDVVASQFNGLNYRLGIRAGTPSAAVKDFIDEMNKLGPILNLSLSGLARDAVFIAKWAFETAQKEKGNTSSESLKAVAESLGTRKLPDDYLVLIGNPNYTATDHTTGNADYSKLWGLVTVSPLENGTYAGELLAVPN